MKNLKTLVFWPIEVQFVNFGGKKEFSRKIGLFQLLGFTSIYHQAKKLTCGYRRKVQTGKRKDEDRQTERQLSFHRTIHLRGSNISLKLLFFSLNTVIKSIDDVKSDSLLSINLLKKNNSDASLCALIQILLQSVIKIYDKTELFLKRQGILKAKLIQDLGISIFNFLKNKFNFCMSSI